jgi:uncharacterized protein (TIGR00369 family)
LFEKVESKNFEKVTEAAARIGSKFDGPGESVYLVSPVRLGEPVPAGRGLREPALLFQQGFFKITGRKVSHQVQQTHGPTDLAHLFEFLRRLYEEQLPFNRVLGLAVRSLGVKQVQVAIPMQACLVGNTRYGILHGGVISAVMDATGGLAATAGVLNHLIGQPMDQITRKVARIGTIDLRVDYLRPGKGTEFLATGVVMRTGSKVAVIRMEMHSDAGVLIAVGTGTYIVG